MEVSEKKTGAAKKLYQLQVLDLKIEAARRSLEVIRSKLGVSQTLVAAQAELKTRTKRLDELSREQKALEWEIEDLSGKIAELEKRLYGGKVSNPKELSGMQQDDEVLKKRRKQAEDRALEIMEQRELTSAGVKSWQDNLVEVEKVWRIEQSAFDKEAGELVEQIKLLEQQRKENSSGLEDTLTGLYDKLKAQKGNAAAIVEQGVCQGCRISLSQAQLRQVRTGSLVQCGNCGRVLYLA